MKYSTVLVLLGMLVFAASMAWGQGANPPASTTASGQTSGQGETGLEQTAKQATLTGCLGGPNDQGVYTLTNDKHKKGMEVASAEGVDLKPHVGHEVKLTGTWTKSGAAIAEKEKGNEKTERQFKATKVAHIADTCATSGETKSKY
jgi:hypothetical protein